ncbi:MAG: ATP-binding cassette domain-containing protein, partial [Pirellulales bacterium]|nr:ATP-binding cassette domain-containing protein [Pirellulales bacterium]
MAELQVDAVTKEYPTRGDPLVVLRGISLELDRRESLAVVGPSGSGKSTLLNIIGTLEPPSSGRVVLAGRDPAELDEPALALFRNRNIGFVFQEHHLLPQCSVLENVLVPTIASGATGPEAVGRARALL